MTLTIGEGAKIDRSVKFFHRTSDIVIGDRATLFRGSEILGPVTIGDGVFINRDAYIRARTTIGDRVNIGPFVRIITDTHEIGLSTRRAGRAGFDEIRIGDGSWIGACATIVGGVPARHIRDLD